MQVVEAVNAKYTEFERKKELSEVLLQLAQETEDLVMKERHHFSPILKKWHSTAGAVAAVMLHTCYGQVLRQYKGEVTSLTNESVQVLQRAGRLEKIIVQIVVEDSNECEDGGKTVVREMVPFDVDSVILSLLGKFIDDSLYKGNECVQRAKETEVRFGFMILFPSSQIFFFFGHRIWFIISFCLLFSYYCRHGIQSPNQNQLHNQLRS